MIVSTISMLFSIVVYGMAVFGFLMLLLLLFSSKETERQRITRETRAAERQVADYGRQAQAAILAEALRRAQTKPTARRTTRQDMPNDGRYGPWDD